MPLVAAVGPALAAIGGGSALAGGLGLAGTAAGIYGAVSQANSAKKAASAAGQAGQVDINALDARTRELARQNAIESAQLEQLLNPEVAALRTAATNGVTQGLQDSGDTTLSRQKLLEMLQNGGLTPLLAAAQTKAGEDLALGGGLSTELQNLITRRGAAQAGTSTGNLGLGRDITARDLGLTSLDLENRRLTNAADIGNMGQSGLINTIQMLRSIDDSRFNRQLAGAQLGQSIQQPVVGLDPGSFANLAVGNSNAAQAALANRAELAGQQSNNWLQLGGQGLGFLLANRKPTVGVSTPVGASQQSQNPYPLLGGNNGGFLGGSSVFSR